MSLATSAAPGSGQTAANSAEQLIDHRIQEARSALWWAELSRSGLRMLIVWLVAVLAWVVIDQWVYSPSVAVRLIVAIGLLSWSARWLMRRVVPLLGRSIRKEYAARSLERDMPEMRQELTSYVTLQDDRDSTGLRSRVVRSIGAQAAGRLRSHDALPQEATGTLRWWMAAAAALALLAGYSVISPKNTFRSATRLFAPLASIEPARRVSIRDVQPGDAEAIAGRRVKVSASIVGLNENDEIWCRWETGGGEQEAELDFDQDTGRYLGVIPLDHSAAGDVTYQIEAGDATAGPFHLRVQDVPVLAVESIRYQPPSYTGEVPHTSSSASITCVDGTEVTILASTNRAVVKANIEFNPRPLGDSIRATAGASEMQIDDAGTTLTISFPLRSARGRSAAVQLEGYRVKVWDAAGQSNPDPIIYPIRVIADLPPEVSIVMPRKSPKDVPIDAQQVIEVHAMDADFGLRRVGLEIRRGIDMVAEPTLWTDPKGAKGNRVSDYRFRPAEHGLRVGDVVQVTGTATDNRFVENDPSIEPNISVTDPIKFRITASEVVANDPNSGDGLSPPDERPASDAGAGEEGKQESGEGSSGGAGASGEGASGEGATGQSGTSSAGTSGEGKTAESGESGTTGEGGTGQSDSSKPNSSGEGSAGTSGESTPSGQPNGAESGQPSGAESGQTPTDGSAAEPNGATGDTPPGSGGEPMPDGSAGGESTTNPATGESASRSSAEGGSTGDDPSGDSSESQQPPSHDAEAFERIRDYLDEMKRKGESSGDEPPDGGASESGSSESGTGESGTGESGTGESGTGESGTGESGTGESGTGESGTGESGTGESGTGESGTGESGTGESGTGESGTGESGTGESGTGETGTGETGTGESGTGESGTGESGTGESGTGESGTGESEKGESGTGESGTGESEKGESEKGESQKGESGTGESGTGESEKGESEKGESEKGESGTGESGKGDSSTPGTPSQPSSDASQTQSQTPDQSQSPSQGGSGSGAGTDAGGPDGDAATPPDPVDLEYAKKATDMVLDYLDQTRDAPDSELLDRLNWTEEDLQRFAERWKEVRELDQTETPDPQGNRDVEEALRSLGLRPPTQATANNRGTSDSLRGVRDAGNRKPPPPAYQDAFDAFRRAMGRRQ